MSGVADGATTRKERLIEIVDYCATFMPEGCPMNQALLHAAFAHGLTDKRTMSYLYEMQRAQVLGITNGRIFVKSANFKRMVGLMFPERAAEEATDKE